jgi:hypothetical protein
MTDDLAQPATAFEPDEGPTHPYATLPEELALHASLADATAPLAPFGGGAVPVAPARSGPRGTLRLQVVAGRGPTGTLLMPGQSRRRNGRSEDDARAARLRRIFVLAIGLLCALDVAWIALHAPPDPPPVSAPSR